MKVRHLVSVIAAMILVVAMCLVASSPAFRIRYHLYRIQAVEDEIYAEPSGVSPEGLVGYGSQELFDKRDHHRDRLVELEYYFHQTYVMENLPVSSDEVSTALWKRVQASFPDSKLPTMQYPGNVIEVWDIPSRRETWDRFVEKYNVSDFEAKFMADE